MKKPWGKQNISLSNALGKLPLRNQTTTATAKNDTPARNSRRARSEDAKKQPVSTRPKVFCSELPPSEMVVLAEGIGNVLQHAMAIADVDLDGLNEIVVGTLGGQLLVFSGVVHAQTVNVPQCSLDGARAPQMLARSQCHGLGSITAVTVGDLLNTNTPIIACTSAQGVCFLFDLSAPGPDQHEPLLAKNETRRNTKTASSNKKVAAKSGESSLQAPPVGKFGNLGKLISPIAECTLSTSASILLAARVGQADATDLYTASDMDCSVCRYTVRREAPSPTDGVDSEMLKLRMHATSLTLQVRGSPSRW